MKKNNNIRTIRLNSRYFNSRKKKMYYLGRPERMKGGKYIITSEEIPFMMLPLIKYAQDTNSVLFFIERGAYSQRISIDLLKDILGFDVVSYSYQIANGKNDFRTINEELAEMIRGYINETHPSAINYKLDKEDIIKLEKLSEGIKNKNQKHKNLLNFLKNLKRYKGKYKIDLLCTLIKLEPLNVLDPVKYSLVKNRANRKGSLNYRAKHSEDNIYIKEEDFGDKNSKYRKEIFVHLKSRFPNGINLDNERSFFHEFNNFNRQFLREHFEEVSFITLPLIKYLTESMGIRLNNVIYCDDCIASGLSYFKTKIFHTLMCDREFRFNIYTHMDDSVDLGETQLTIDTDFYEDIPETFGFYYSNGKRIKYKRERISKEEKKRYNCFVNYLNSLINRSCEFIRVLNLADKKSYPLIRDLSDKSKRYLSMCFFL